MQADLAFSDTAYGIGAGIFFIGYFFFEVPSNLLMRRVGARLWIARIMIVWGLVSAASMFVNSVASFYVLRFLLGVAEAGFFPGIIWYLTQWYTRAHRAQIIALFMTAIAVSGVIGGPLSGWILDVMEGVSGLRGWRWLYLLEGLPSVVVGFVVLRYLDDGPHTATWLTPEERALVQRRLAEDEEQKQAAGATAHRVGDAFRSGRVWACCAIYFGAVMGIYGVTFWLPQIISETITRDPFTIGLVSTIPWGVAAVAMVLVGRHSDRTGERRWHIAIPAGVGGGLLLPVGAPGSLGLGRRGLFDRGHRWSDVRRVELLGSAHGDAVGKRSGRGHRLDQLSGKSLGLRQPVSAWRDPRRHAGRRAPEREHVARAERPGRLVARGRSDRARVATQGLQAPGSRLRALGQRANRTVPGVDPGGTAVLQ